MAIITEEMRLRKRLCLFAQKYGVTKAAQRYHTNRTFVYRQLDKFDGTVRSLALKSRRPHSHPNQHTEEELELIRKTHSRYGRDGQAEVYVQLRKRGYTRSYGSMCKQIRKLKPVKKKKRNRTSYRKHKEVRGKSPGDKVQIDIKYVPMSCILFNSHGKRYYQITALDEYSRKRILDIVDEKTVTHTKRFLESLEARMGFKITTVQTDNGREFVNDDNVTDKLSAFEKELKRQNIKYKRTAPYSPWQNGKVERSHKLDNERLYDNAEFTSEADMIKKLKRYNTRYNNIHRKVLNFKNPNQMVKEYTVL